MGDNSGISWTNATWNPVSGCTKLTPECTHCYAERDWHRLTHLAAYAGREFTDVACHEDRLDQPIRWKRPRLIFVCSMSDLFHDDVPDDFIDQVFAVMALSPQHTFQVLTKRAERMQRYLSDDHRASYVEGRAERMARGRGAPIPEGKYLKWPLAHVWVGVTAGTQATANERIPLLMKTPAAKHWVSMEPLLGPVDLLATPAGDILCRCDGCIEMTPETRLDWVVVGGESGPKARPMHSAWVKALRDQCVTNHVTFFFKQWGEWIPGRDATNDQLNNPRVRGGWVSLAGGFHDGNNAAAFLEGDENVLRVGRKSAGECIEGVEYKEMPC